MAKYLRVVLIGAVILLAACDGEKPSQEAVTPPWGPNVVPVGSASGEAPAIKILRWGPHATQVGQVFNKQPDGLSALWFEMTGTVQANTMEAWFGDQKMEGLAIASDKGGSIQVPAEILAKAARYPVYLIHKPSNTRFDIGSFEVLPGPNDPPGIKILKWGPHATQVGQVFNKQPDGLSALWFEMSGSVQANTMEAWFGEQKLEGLAIASDKGGSIQVPAEILAKAAKYPVYLIHKPSNTRFDIGSFEVVPGK